MTLVSERAFGTVGDGREVVVVVGVKFDSQSKQLLTWALMKMANPGDRVIALHVLDSISGGTASPMSLVKTFDSFLAVYEGFCNLKQLFSSLWHLSLHPNKKAKKTGKPTKTAATGPMKSSSYKDTNICFSIYFVSATFPSFLLPLLEQEWLQL